MFWAVAFILGYIGWVRYFIASGEMRSPSDLFYPTAQLFTLESGAVHGPTVGLDLEIARLLAPAVAAYTAFWAIVAIFSEQMRVIRTNRIRNQIVICGSGRRGSLLAQGSRQRGERVVVIDRDENNDYV